MGVAAITARSATKRSSPEPNSRPASALLCSLLCPALHPSIGSALVSAPSQRTIQRQRLVHASPDSQTSHHSVKASDPHAENRVVKKPWAKRVKRKAERLQIMNLLDRNSTIPTLAVGASQVERTLANSTSRPTTSISRSCVACGGPTRPWPCRLISQLHASLLVQPTLLVRPSRKGHTALQAAWRASAY